MGALMRAHDWRATELGPPETWPQSLRTVVRLMLTSNHPMFIFWGDEHRCFYNDAYSTSIGPEKHPAMLGARGRDMWGEIWAIIGPQIAMVLAGDGATWHENQLVPIIRHGQLEDVYWTYGFSPIDDEGATNGIGGVLVVCTETTQHVLAQRRHAFLMDLGDKIRSLADIKKIESIAASMLGKELAVDRVAFSIIDERADMAVSRYEWTRDGRPSGLEVHRLGVFDTDFIHALRHGEAVVVNDIHEDPRARELHPIYEALNIRAFVAAPLIRDGVLTNCLYLQDIQPRRWSAREIDLVQDVADRTWEAFERARAEETKSLLINELNHRVRNTLAVVGAIASQTRRHSSSLKDFGRAFDGRVQALAATHTLLSDSKWADSGLHILIERQLIPFTQRANTIDISGPAVVLGPKRALALSLVLHELGTNAAKFGALSTTTGHIDIAWTVSQELGDRTLLLRWTERGGPPVASPVQIGFGTKLIDHNISHEFGGEVEREFHPDGFTCTMTIPLPQSSDAS